jgi:hypothetical protein
MGVPIVGISGLPFGSLGTKWHLGVGPMARHRVYYKGEGGGFPQVQAMVSFVSLSLPMAHPNTKSVVTLALGLRPTQGGYKVIGQEEARESHRMLSGV